MGLVILNPAFSPLASKSTVDPLTYSREFLSTTTFIPLCSISVSPSTLLLSACYPPCTYTRKKRSLISCAPRVVVIWSWAASVMVTSSGFTSIVISLLFYSCYKSYYKVEIIYFSGFILFHHMILKSKL